MRFLRLIFVLALAAILIAMALANRQVVTLSALPANLGQYLGSRWAVDVPLFLVIFLVFAFGMLAGLIWEYLREADIRREARNDKDRAAQLESEVSHLRERHAAPKDEILAILNRPKAAPVALPIASSEPASGMTLPAQR